MEMTKDEMVALRELVKDLSVLVAHPPPWEMMTPAEVKEAEEREMDVMGRAKTFLEKE